MLWPTGSDYVEVMQNCKRALTDPDLRTGAVELTRLGLPKPRAGQFAVVFKVQAGSATWAVRCFTHPVADHQWRYEAISRHLRQARLPCMVGFEYQPKGILFRGNTYPVLKMEWAQGQTVDQFIESHLHDQKSLRWLAEQLLEVTRALKRYGIAHGDIQDGNMIISRTGIRLVDYDGMYVPSLNGSPSIELGHPNYQHPLRTGSHFGPFLDAFSEWVIYLSILAVESDPTIWQKTRGGDNCLIFRRHDLEDPANSPVFHELLRSSNNQVKSIAEFLAHAAFMEPPDVPLLESGNVPNFVRKPVAALRRPWPHVQGSPAVKAKPGPRGLPPWVRDHRQPPSRPPLIPHTGRLQAPMARRHRPSNTGRRKQTAVRVATILVLLAFPLFWLWRNQIILGRVDRLTETGEYRLAVQEVGQSTKLLSFGRDRRVSSLKKGWADRIRLRIAAGDRAAAAAEAQEFTLAFPKDPEVEALLRSARYSGYIAMGQATEKAGRYLDAAQAFKEAVQIGVDAQFPRTCLRELGERATLEAERLAFQGDIQEAITHYELAETLCDNPLRFGSRIKELRDLETQRSMALAAREAAAGSMAAANQEEVAQYLKGVTDRAEAVFRQAEQSFAARQFQKATSLWTSACSDLSCARGEARRIRDLIRDGKLRIVHVTADVKIVLRHLPPGEFDMAGELHLIQGNRTDESRRVRITKGVYISATEVTQQQWKTVMGNNPSRFRGDDLPVETVSWNDASKFCETLSKSTRGTWRLPSEAEWAYACRGDEIALVSSDSRQGIPLMRTSKPASDGAPSVSNAGTYPVGRSQSNALGLFDTEGNVREWCSSATGTMAGNPRGPEQGDYRVLRGGSWRDPPAVRRSTARLCLPADARDSSTGFRVVMEDR